MMEGGGEGVVAVVRWLSDAGLAVGLLAQSARPIERAQRENGGRVSSAPRRALRERVSQTLPERALKHRPVGPEPYASTYQVTHCGADDCSPARWHTEFPPQRLKPSTALGNFEVGHRSRSPARSDSYSYRIEKGTGFQFRPQHDRDVEAFVSSLRKYPSSTERTPSADLLEKLLKNSQTHSSKESPPAKKRRHHWDKPQPLGPLSIYVNRSRDRKSHRNPEPVQSDQKQPEKYPLPGPVSITAFDYLNSGTSSPKTPEKKVEKTDNKQLKNTFRETHREKRPVTAFPLCPILRSRFEKHMKQYHPTTSKNQHVDFENLDWCNKCMKRRPCACEIARNMRRVVEKVEQERRQLEDAIFSWLKDIPIYPNENPHDKYIRDVIVKKLAESLCGMSERQFDKEGKEEIERALEKMPMWYPSNEREREHFKNMITENLMEKIKSIKELKSFDQAIEDFFDGITFSRAINRSHVLNHVIAELNKVAASRPEDDNTYRDLLKMKAFELMDQLPIKTSGNKYEFLNQLSDELAEHLLNPHLDQEAKQTIKDEIGSILNDLRVPLKNRAIVEEGLRKLVADIAIKDMDIVKAESLIKCLLEGNVSEDNIEAITTRVLALAEKVKPTDAKLNQQAKQMVRDMLDNAGVDIKNKAKIEEGLQRIARDVATESIDEDTAIDQVKSLLHGNVAEDQLSDITDQVLEMAHQLKPVKLDQETKEMIKDNVRDVLDLSGVKIKDREKIENTLNKIVNDVATTGMDEEKAEAMIKSLLKGKVPEDKQDDIVDQVLKLANQVTPIQKQQLDKETKQMIKGDIHDALDLSGVKIKDKEKIENNLMKIVNDVATRGMDEEKAEAMIKSVLKGKVPEDKQDDIIDQVLKLANQVTPIQAQPLEKETKQMIKDDIHDALDLPGVKIKDKEKIENNLIKIVQDVASSGMSEDKAEAMIKSLLNGKVPGDKQDDIIDQVLKLANQVKPIQAQPLDRETKEIIKSDIHDVLDIPGIKSKDREKIETNLNKIVQDIASSGMSEDKAEAMIKSLLKGKVPGDRQDDIIDQVLKLANQVKPIQAQPLDRETKEIIKSDIRDVLDIPGIKSKDREKIETNLNKIVQDIASSGMSEDKAEAMIKSLLKGKVPGDKQDDIIDQVLKLANQVKPIQAQPLDKETKQIIKSDIHDVLDLSGTKIKDREKIENSLNKIVQDIATKGMDEGKTEAMIKSLLEGKVSEDKQRDITDQILKLANQMKPTRSKPLDQETKQTIKKDVSDILDLLKPNIKNRAEVEENVRDLISSMLSRGIEKDKAKIQLKSILKGKVSDDEVDEIANKFLELGTNMKTKQTIIDDPKFQETLKHDISDILVDTDISMKNRSKLEESLRDIVSDVVMRGMDKNQAQDYINSTLKGKVSDSQAKDISKKILALAEQKSLSISRESSGPLASSTQYEDKIYHDQVYGKTRDWLKNMDIGLKDEQINEVAEAIANETLDRQKYLQLNPGVKVSEKKESEILKEQIYKALNKFVDKKSVQSIMKNADDLMHSLNEVPPLQISSGGLVQDSIEFVQENLEGALLNWLRGSPIYQTRSPNNKQSQEQAMSNLAKSLAAVLSSQTMSKSGTKSDEALLREIIKHLEDLPLEPQFKSKDYIKRLGAHMLDYLKSLQLFQDISARSSLKTSQRTNSSLMPSTNHLNDIVNDWCEEIPLPNTDESFRIQQDLANKIILKIGEMNMNQDIFNDDSLYEEILQDFIDQQANAFEIGQYITEDYKRVLIDQIKQVKQKVQDDLVGRAYKQQLRDTISNTVPSMACPTVDDLASFELMKENLADAFINLNYSGEDEAVKAKFKRRIIDEVNKYVNEYLNRCPAPPVNASKLNEDLYKALINVPIPGDESMRSEVETVRMKDLINDWLKTIPMHKQRQADLLRTNKIITLMAQKLQELENDFNQDFEDIAVEEIVTYLKKLPLKNKNNLNGMAKRLVEKIKSTTDSRSFIDGTRSKLDDCLCTDVPVPPVLTAVRPCNVPVPPACSSRRTSRQSCASFIPPCGLSKEDQELLRKIRERSGFCEAGTPFRKCRDAAINPPPLDHESQTEMPNQSKSCQHTDKSEPVCSKFLNQTYTRAPVSSRPCRSTGSQADVCPYVLVKEYYWDSPSGNRTEFATQTTGQEPGRICIPSTRIGPESLCHPRECIRRPTPLPPRLRQHLETPSCRRTPHEHLETPTCRRTPCDHLETPSCRRTPKRQFTSACPSGYFSRPKQHNCMRPTRPCQELRSQNRRGEPSCPRKKPSCQTCQNGPKLCPDCIPLNVCPYPTCLYFK